MERAPLRPVPRRPPEPVDPEVAIAAVARALPGLDERPGAALALVALAGRNRAEAAARLGIERDELAAALTAGRKALRRKSVPLAASGWCERAEGLISDRLDGELDETGAARLEVHLRNCERCVEHERRLVQATDSLVESVAGPAPAGEPAPPADLRAVEPRPREPERPARPIAVLPFGEPVAPKADREREPAADAEAALTEREAPSAAPELPSMEPEAPAAEPEVPAAETEVPAAEPEVPAVRPRRPRPVEPAAPVVAPLPSAARPRSARQLAGALAWHALFALAVLLAIATVAITVYGVTGGEL